MHRQSFRYRAGLLLGWLLLVLPAWSQPVWVASDLYDQVGVVVAKSASPQQKRAAEVFVKYWNLTTGHDAGVSQAPEKRVNIWIGRNAMPEEFLVDLNFDGLGVDGFILDTLRQPVGNQGADALKTDRHLLVIGGEQGVIYAIYHFFNEFMGVRWLAPGDVYVPQHAPPALPEISARVEPAFEYRYTDYMESIDDQEFAEAHKLLTDCGFGLFAHTVYELVPPETYFEEHPEYYSLISGTRRAPVAVDWRDPVEARKHPQQLGQLCFSSPDVAKVISDELRRRIRENPKPGIWSVSQMDWGNYCECETCRALDEREGTHAASLLTCVNRVARALAAEFPEHRIETLAQDWSRKPPRQLTPEPNVIIRLSTRECDFSRPLANPKSLENRRFQDDIDAWARLTSNLYIWDYAANLHNFQAPHPNIDVIQPNLQFFKERGVIGVFEQGCPGPGGEFAALRQYLLGTWLWEPGREARAVISEFINLYYGPAAQHIRDYLELMTQAMQDAEVHLTCVDGGAWMDYKVVSKAQELFRKASETVGEAEPYQQRLELAQVPVQYASLACPPDLLYERYAVTLRRPLGPTLDEYVELLQGLGITHTVDKQPFEAVVEQIGGVTPPRRIESELRILENEYYLIWVAPSLDGAVIRWRDKKLGVELLQGYRCYGRGPGTLQEWRHAPEAQERVVATGYTVDSPTLYALALSTQLPNGLAMKREMELRPASPEFVITLTLTNTSSESIVPNVKIHPEFALGNELHPEIWLEDNRRWTAVPNAALNPQAMGGDYLKPLDGNRWAFRLPRRGLTLINQFVPHQVESLFYFYNTLDSAEHINLELIPKQDPLQPGRSRQLKSTYSTSAKRLP